MWSRAMVLGAAASLAACGDVQTSASDASSRDVVCGAQPVEVLPNGSFDASTPPWTQDPVTPSLLCGMPGITPADGTTAACLGGTDGLVQTMSQTVKLPAGVKNLTLTGQICIDTAETVATANDTLVFDVLGGTTAISTLGTKSNQQGAHPCVFSAFTFTAPITSDPVTATFRFTSTLNNTMPTSFYVDKLSLTATCN
ncbi:MAG TPA: hypothetical protein VGC42_16955 [Kofleriaceae bacterium]